MTTLHANPDDLLLNAESDTGYNAVNIVSIHYLVDTAGNFLTDMAGNRLIGYLAESVNAKVLHALPDDLVLNSQ